jgi:alkanesulfonate monooxygenase SsuD/methylene tetrahydromethanopterin reductase-like flavin-dependent oxidoreductase (luciferase family)
MHREDGTDQGFGHDWRVTEGRALKVGIQLPEVERVVRWPELRAMARLAEEAGFDSLWLGDHLLYREEVRGVRGPWEVWTSLAGLAAATTRIALGPLVASTSFHAPAMLAKMAATVDEISGGRLILGLGAGWNQVEYEAFGFPFDHRIGRFEEAFTIIRHLLREGACDFAGAYYTVRDCELRPAPRPGGPPLMIGSSGERMLRITMAHVDAWNVWYDDIDNTPARLAEYRDRVDAACADVGRDPSEVERTAGVLVRLAGGTGRDDAGSRRGVPPLGGTSEEIAAGLRGFAAEGIAHVQLVLDPITEASIAEVAPVLEHLDRS